MPTGHEMDQYRNIGVIADAISSMDTKMSKLVEHLTNAKHIPAVAPLNDGKWGVFCLACSDEKKDYIYPCQVIGQGEQFPPNVLQAIPASVLHTPDGNGRI